MKWPTGSLWAVVAATVVGAGAFVAFGQDAGTAPGTSAAALAARLFASKDDFASPLERREAMHSLNGEYVAVRDAVLDVLRNEKLAPGSEIDFGSRVHDALRTARTWRIREARSELVALATIRLRPLSIPIGINMKGTSLYPAAEALAAVAGPPESLVTDMTEANSPYVLWAMTEAYGRRSTVALLRSCKELRGIDASLVDKAVERVQSVEHTSDLLPRLIMNK
jgi:hypothetical protein